MARQVVLVPWLVRHTSVLDHIDYDPDPTQRRRDVGRSSMQQLESIPSQHPQNVTRAVKAYTTGYEVPSNLRAFRRAYIPPESHREDRIDSEILSDAGACVR